MLVRVQYGTAACLRSDRHESQEHSILPYNIGSADFRWTDWTAFPVCSAHPEHSKTENDSVSQQLNNTNSFNNNNNNYFYSESNNISTIVDDRCEILAWFSPPNPRVLLQDL